MSSNKVKSRKKSKGSKGALKALLNRHKVASVIILIVSIVALAGVLIYVGITIANELSKSQVANEVVLSRERFDPDIEQVQKTKSDFIIHSGIVDQSSRILRSKIDECILIPTTSGWTTTDWRQKCFFTSVDYIPTTSSKDEVIKVLANSANSKRVIGEVDAGINLKNCSIFIVNGLTTLRYFAPTESSESCKDVKSLVDGVEGDVLPVRNGLSKVVLSFSHDDVDRSKAYIKVESRTDYYVGKKLGCKPMSLFCGPPGEVVTGFEK